MRYLITGASGFIGRNILNGLILNNEDEVITLGRTKITTKHHNHTHYNCDYTSNIDVGHIDILYHCAGNPNPSLSNDDKEHHKLITKFLIDNISSDLFVYISSLHVYKHSPYGTAKEFGEFITLQHNNPKILRLCPIVGSNMSYGLLVDLIRQIPNGKFTPKGNFPGGERQYLHINDLVYYLQNIYKLKDIFYDVTNIESISVNYFIWLLNTTLGIQLPVLFEKKEYSRKDILLGDYRKLYNELGKPYLDTIQAVKRSIDENRNIIQPSFV